MTNYIPNCIDFKFEEFCKDCNYVDIEARTIPVLSSKGGYERRTTVTCSNIKGCRGVYEFGKRMAFNEGGVKTNSCKCENCKHCEDEWLSLGFPHVKCDLTEYIIFPETLNDCENFEEKEVENGSDRIN